MVFDSVYNTSIIDDPQQIVKTALAYLDLGLTPVPLCRPNPSGDGCIQHGPDCPSPGKRPLVPWKKPRHHNGAILEPLVDKPPWGYELRGWVNKFGEINVGIIVPEGIVVIDIDPRNGGDETAHALGLTEIETPTTLTGGGGQHLWFKHDGYLPPLLGPGVDVKGPGTLVVMPPSVHSSGRQYDWEIGYELGCIEMAQLSILKKLPENIRKPTGRHGEDKDGFIWVTVETALEVNGMLPEAYDLLSELYKPLLELFHSGVPEGVRFSTLCGLLTAARYSGAVPEEIECLAMDFGARCTPPFPEKESKPLVNWINKRIRPWDPDVESERTGPSLAAWKAGVWDNERLDSLTSTDPNGAPAFLPLYFPYGDYIKNGKHTGKIGASEVITAWHEEQLQDSWHTEGPLDRAIESISLCGSWGIREDKEHRTKSAHRACKHPLHDECFSGIQHKARKLVGWDPVHDPTPGWISNGIPNAAKDARSLLVGPTTLLSVSILVEWPGTDNELEIAHHHIKEVCAYRTQGLPDGALVALRLEPFNGCFTAYILAPGHHKFPQNGRGRPPKYPVTVIGHYDGEPGLKKWLEHSGGAWVGYVPDDENATDAVVRLLYWCHRRSRTWGTGKLKKLLAEVRFIHQCPVCGEPTTDGGFYHPTRHERVFTVDSQGREYWAVRDKPPNTSSGGT